MTTEEKVQTAFLNMMEKISFTDITVTALSKKAGISRRTFYRHYTSIASVLSDFEDTLAKRCWKAAMQQPYSNRRLIESMSTNIMQYDGFFENLAVTHKHSLFVEHTVNIMTRVFEEVFQPIAPMSMDEFRMQSRFIASGISGVYLEWLRNDRPISINELTVRLDNMVSKELDGMQLRASISCNSEN